MVAEAGGDFKGQIFEARKRLTTRLQDGAACLSFSALHEFNALFTAHMMMYRRSFAALMILTVTSVSAPAAAVVEGPQGIRAASYIVVDANTGVPMLVRNADEERAVASTQKIITALVVVDQGNLDRRVTVQAGDIEVEPTRLGVRPGESYTVRELLYAFLVKSANDVAQVLARVTAGSQPAFAVMMNAKAKSLGMSNSYFINPHGLPARGQHSTARDMARAALAAYRSPIIRDAIQHKYLSFHFASGRSVTLENTNELLGRMPECNGMKTGYTNAAGRCLLASASSNGRAVIAVQLGTKTKYIWDDGAILMRWGLARATRGSLK
ncbi:MAG: Serine-type D-Ala-D-Ala carboxypeptidase [Verrucomicrobiaceae bacterium]|nr:Serine-type D-Ala-D-Ala carboxypeptidase [Verrucomicrobiaceae bacterium]